MPIDANGVIGRVADVGMALLARLDVGTDTSIPEQVDPHAEDGANQFRAGERFLLHLEHRAHRCTERNRLGIASEHAAPLADQVGVVILPGGAGKPKESFAFLVRTFRVRVGIEKNVQVVERRDQLERATVEEAVSEHVTRHVADARDRDDVLVNLHAEFAEVPADAFPRTPRRDALGLVIVAMGSPGSEGIAEPEVVLE